MEFGLQGKNALVIGGTKGLGRATCELFAQEGTNVIAVSRHEDDCAALAAQLRERYGVQAAGIACDLSGSGRSNVVREALAAFGTLDMLVNAAGIWPQAYVLDMEEEAFRHTIEVNLVSPFVLCRDFARYLVDQKKPGKIVNVVSQAASAGSTTGHAHYAASKGGLVSFTVSLARELAPHGINVNAVAPGIMDTPMIHEVLKTRREYYCKRIPLGRVAEPEEVAYSILFLCSNKADYLTGITLDATGGMLMR